MLYLEVLFQEKTNINTNNYDYCLGKTYDSVFSGVIVDSSVTTTFLTETILIAMLFPFCCEVSTKYKHLCYPIIANFKKI